MADNVIVTPGTGATIAADELTDATLGSVKVQYVKLMDGTLDGSTKAAVGVNGLAVDVKASVLPTGAATSALQTTGNTSLATIATNLPAQGQALAAASMPVVLTAAQITTLTPPAAISGFATATKQDTGNTSLSSIDGKLPALGQALAAASVPVILPSATITTLTPPAAITGFATAAKQPALGTAGSASSDVITIQGIASGTVVPISVASIPSHAVTNAGTFAVQSAATLQTQTDTVMVGGVNIKEINAVTPLMGNGTTGTGSQRVTIASDNTAFSVNAVESGTWTVQPGNTANTTPWLTTQTPATSGGLTIYHVTSAGSTNLANIKASAGQVFGWYIYNSNAAARKVVLHNVSGTPTAGATVTLPIMIPPTSAANVEFTNGIVFGTGIGISTVTDLADSGTTAVAANDLIINILYK